MGRTASIRNENGAPFSGSLRPAGVLIKVSTRQFCNGHYLQSFDVATWLHYNRILSKTLMWTRLDHLRSGRRTRSVRHHDIGARTEILSMTAISDSTKAPVRCLERPELFQNRSSRSGSPGCHRYGVRRCPRCSSCEKKPPAECRPQEAGAILNVNYFSQNPVACPRTPWLYEDGSTSKPRSLSGVAA